ncbi:LANO_0G01090g1_1 [Lachancea nothofagi CBS 11611]|uniref:LANO_0G01090g1_1 n=1 Tax=Lachancea nothofagi CBS 11611 TaxID=1266666 RepID=A0A1G4KEH0_9SACH|nr:LANO_0G01090g1_1 [Lachancea nothofagi CBS 11611]
MLRNLNCTPVKRVKLDLKNYKTTQMSFHQNGKRASRHEASGIFVRGPNVPKAPHSASAYFRAAACVVNDVGLSKSRMLENQHFRELTAVSYEPHEARAKYIENYLETIGISYQQQESRSNKELKKKLEKVKSSIDVVPQPQADANGDAEAVAKAEALLQKALRKTTHEHSPKVCAVPGNSNFAYLSNAIRHLAAQRTVCFCVDVEAFERNTNVVTEIGISIYDPRESLFSTIPKFRTYHLIVAESLKLRNGKFVCDLKDCFLMGESYVMSLNNCVEFIQTLINYYMVPETAAERSWDRAFVGHNVKGDLKWLESIGVNIPTDIDYELKNKPQTTNRALVLDTERLFKGSYGSKGANLGKILRLFEVPHAFLHNAGNDAYFTLKLLLHMCDIHCRKQMQMDDFYAVMAKIETWTKRDSSEAKILPLSYVKAAAEFTDHTVKKKTVHQTEFGGCVWVDNPIQAITMS